MQNLKAILTLVLATVVVLVLGFWAIRTIEPGNVHAEREKQKELEEKNRELEKELEKLEKEIAMLRPPAPAPEEQEENPSPAPAPESSAPSEHRALLSELQKLTDDKIQMKVGSRGTRVGTIQTFLNIYFKTNKRIDNDYGRGTKTDVENFQKAEGLAVDGEAGPATYQKMIDWLRSQS